MRFPCSQSPFISLVCNIFTLPAVRYNFTYPFNIDSFIFSRPYIILNSALLSIAYLPNNLLLLPQTIYIFRLPKNASNSPSPIIFIVSTQTVPSECICSNSVSFSISRDNPHRFFVPHRAVLPTITCTYLRTFDTFNTISFCHWPYAFTNF